MLSATATSKVDTIDVNGFTIAFEISSWGITNMVDVLSRSIFSKEELHQPRSTERKCPSPHLMSDEENVLVQERKLKQRKWKRKWRRKAARLETRREAATSSPTRRKSSLKRTAQACISLTSYRCERMNSAKKANATKTRTTGKRKSNEVATAMISTKRVKLAFVPRLLMI